MENAKHHIEGSVALTQVRKSTDKTLQKKL